MISNHGGHAMKKDTSRQQVEQSEVGLSVEDLIPRTAWDQIQGAAEVRNQAQSGSESMQSVPFCETFAHGAKQQLRSHCGVGHPS